MKRQSLGVRGDSVVGENNVKNGEIEFTIGPTGHRFGTNDLQCKYGVVSQVAEFKSKF